MSAADKPHDAVTFHDRMGVESGPTLRCPTCAREIDRLRALLRAILDADSEGRVQRHFGAYADALDAARREINR